MHKMPINAEKMPIHAIVLQTITLEISTFEECTKKELIFGIVANGL